MRKGNVFEGWSEGVLCFPPTYKYEIDSENYIGDDPESGKRRPAWYFFTYYVTAYIFFTHRKVKK